MSDCPNVTDLMQLGWGPFFSSQLSEEEIVSLVPGRAVADRGPRLSVRFESGDRLVVVPGRLRAAGEVPVVGDFVLVRPTNAGEEPEVERVLDRRTTLCRGAAGRASVEQVLAANVDLVLIAHGLDAPVNRRRLERTLAAVYASGAAAAVVLTKADLCADAEAAHAEALRSAPDVPVVVTSGTTGCGLESVRGLVGRGTTAVLIGPSGAGKSTLLNGLLGRDERRTGAVRVSDGRGRHVTTGRELLEVPDAGLIIDSPGIRELKLWDTSGLEATFLDLSSVARGCRFSDCRHESEPGCAVREAVARGEIELARLESFRKLEHEARWMEQRSVLGAARAERDRWRSITREQKRMQRDRNRSGR